MTTDEIIAQMSAETEKCRTEPLDKFLVDVANNARYWSKVGKTPEDIATGTTFSLLVMMDGGNLGSPAIDMAYAPDHDDVKPGFTLEDYSKVFNDSSQMHELFYPVYREVVKDDTASEFHPNNEGKVTMLHKLYSAVESELKNLDPAEFDGADSGHRAAFIAKHIVDHIEAVRVEESKVAPMMPVMPADVKDPYGWLVENIPNYVGLSDARKIELKQLYTQDVSKLRDSVNDFMERMREEFTHLDAITLISQPTFNTVVPREERIQQFIANCANIAEFYGQNADTPAEAAEGAVGSILAMFDGGGDLPPLDIVPTVIPELIQEYNAEGEAGWPAESINSDTGLLERFKDEMAVRMASSAASALE